MTMTGVKKNVLCVAATAAAALVVGGSATNPADFQVPKVAFSDLATGDADSGILDALTSVGIVAVTGVPELYVSKEQALLDARLCTTGEQEKNAAATFTDGTTRVQLQTTIDGFRGYGNLKLESGMLASDAASACPESFAPSVTKFREVLSSAEEAFLKRMDAVFAPESAVTPLLEDSVDESVKYHGFTDLVKGGRHVENIRVFKKNADQGSQGKLFDLHADTGLMVAFVPAVMLDSENQVNSDSAETGAFAITLPNDEIVKKVDFGSDPDTVVFLLGLAVNDIYNARSEVTDDTKKLRPCPHSMDFSGVKIGTQRLWYGNAFYPPSSAKSPASGKSFREIYSDQRKSILNGKDNIVVQTQKDVETMKRRSLSQIIKDFIGSDCVDCSEDLVIGRKMLSGFYPKLECCKEKEYDDGLNLWTMEQISVEASKKTGKRSLSEIIDIIGSDCVDCSEDLVFGRKIMSGFYPELECCKEKEYDDALWTMQELVDNIFDNRQRKSG